MVRRGLCLVPRLEHFSLSLSVLFPRYEDAEYTRDHARANADFYRAIHHNPVAYTTLRLQHLILGLHYPRTPYYAEIDRLDPSQTALYNELPLLHINPDYATNKMDPFARSIGEVGFLSSAVAILPGACDAWLSAVFQGQRLLAASDFCPLQTFHYTPSEDYIISFSTPSPPPQESIPTSSTLTSEFSPSFDVSEGFTQLSLNTYSDDSLDFDYNSDAASINYSAESA